MHNLKVYNKKDFKVKNGVCRFKDYKTSEKYLDFFLEDIFMYKLDLYKYVLGLYKYYMYPQKFKLPLFNLKKH